MMLICFNNNGCIRLGVLLGKSWFAGLSIWWMSGTQGISCGVNNVE